MKPELDVRFLFPTRACVIQGALVCALWLFTYRESKPKPNPTSGLALAIRSWTGECLMGWPDGQLAWRIMNHDWRLTIDG